MLKCKQCGAEMKCDDVSEDTEYYECPDCGEMASKEGKTVRWNSEV